MKRIVALVALSVCASAVMAEPAKPSSAAGDERVCITEPSTGSHIKKRTCMTKTERDRLRAENQEAAKRLNRSKTGGGGYEPK